jgi:hypothetical protein
VSKPILFADFNNADTRGRLRLNCEGTIEDLARQNLKFAEGLLVILHDEELEADAEIHFSPEENVWVGVIDWRQVRQRAS